MSGNVIRKRTVLLYIFKLVCSKVTYFKIDTIKQPINTYG